MYRGLKLGLFAARIVRDYGARACKQEHVVVARDANTDQRLVVHMRTALFRMRVGYSIINTGNYYSY